MKCDEFKESFKEKYGFDWNPYSFNWSDYTLLEEFVREFNEYFDCWWDPELYNYDYSEFLVIYCSNHFDKWWDPIKVNWYYSSLYLAMYCSRYFKKWWSPKRFYVDQVAVKALFEHCSDYKHLWYEVVCAWQTRSSQKLR